MSHDYRAKLIGGPCDGQTVEIVGQCWIKKVQRRQLIAGKSLWFEAIYEWREVNGAQGHEPEFIGIFMGYFDGATKVDRLGRRMGKRRKKQCN